MVISESGGGVMAKVTRTTPMTPEDPMANTTEDGSSDLLIDVISTIDKSEHAALAAIREFVESVDEAIPSQDGQERPKSRVAIVEAGLTMLDHLLGIPNDAAKRLTVAVREALPRPESLNGPH